MTTFRIRGVIIGAVLALIASSGMTAATAASSATTSTSFGLTKSGGEAALGTVSSSRPQCVKKRKVKLFLVRPGKSRLLVGVDRATGKPAGNGDGYWVIPANLKPQRKYVAVVTKRKVKKVVCKAYTTSKLRYAG